MAVSTAVAVVTTSAPNPPLPTQQPHLQSLPFHAPTGPTQLPTDIPRPPPALPVHTLDLEPEPSKLRRRPGAPVEAAAPQPLADPYAATAVAAAVVRSHELGRGEQPGIVVGGSVAFVGRRREGDPDRVCGDLVGGGVGDFEVVF